MFNRWKNFNIRSVYLIIKAKALAKDNDFLVVARSLTKWQKYHIVAYSGLQFVIFHLELLSASD